MLPFLLLAAVTIRSPQTPLRAGCAGNTDVIAQLEAGQTVQVRFALAGATPCHKISASVDGRLLNGYVDSRELEGLDAFDRKRQEASGLTGNVKILSAAIAAVQEQTARSAQGEPRMRTALDAIHQNEPVRALSLLQPLLRSRSDPATLALAGVAAWRSDDPRNALDYWKRSLELRPDPQIERLCRIVERETAGDRSSEKIYGLRVVLRYEPGRVTVDQASAMVAMLDSEWQRISEQLGCIASERIVAVVQSREAYLASTGAAEWSAGRYDGKVRVALVERSDAGLKARRLFAHELVHACLAGLGQWPAWLHEGLAQKLAGDRLNPAERALIDRRIAGGYYPELQNLGRDMARMTPAAARATYALALRATDLLFESSGAIGIRNVLANPARIAQITRELNRRLGL